jgi:hypothetical protein
MRTHPTHRPVPSILATLALASLAAACGRDDDPEATRIEPPPAALGVTDEQQPTPGFGVVRQAVFRAGPAAATAVAGRATFLVPTAEAGTPDGMQVEVRLEGLAAGTDYGWHIFQGRCDDEGSVIVALSPGAAGIDPGTGTEAVAQPLHTGADGVATQTAVVPTAQLTPAQLDQRDHSVRVYDGLSPEPSRLVACADVGTTSEPAPSR